ncbi:MAG: hypothetical protein ACRENI_00940 [Gemmatimonadaceae bacterium]
MMRATIVRPAVALAFLALSACATGAGTTAGTGDQAGGAGDEIVTPTAANPWPVATREHVDLWLHGYAMLQRDTARVPFFSRDYRQTITRLKNSANVATMLDANAEPLRSRFAINPRIEGAQFIALYFGSWDSLLQAVELFLEADGEPRRSNDRTAQQIIAFFAGYFPNAADREWLGLFVRSLVDERDSFYHEFWLEEQREGAGARQAVDSLWQNVYHSMFDGFLDKTGQETGTFLLSLPLNGEGRTITGSVITVGSRLNIVTTGFPENPTRAIEAIYVFAHESIGAVTGIVVNDQTTPAEKRQGLDQGYQTSALVRGGEMLVERIAPELADGYAAYYLRAAGRQVPTGRARSALAAAFPLPDTIIDGIDRQLDIVLGGI